MAQRFDEASVHKSIEVDLKLLDFYDSMLNNLELHTVNTAKKHNPNTFYLLRSIPGVGKILSLTLLYEIHEISRFPRVQDFVSYARLLKPLRKSTGKKHGTGKGIIGNVHMKCAFSEAACLFLRNNPAAQRHHDRLVSKHGKAIALSIIAHKLGRAVYFSSKEKRRSILSDS